MHPTTDRTRRALAAYAALLVAGAAVPAAAHAKARRAKKPKESADVQRQKQEDARLLRECRGRPNSGACLGYAN